MALSASQHVELLSTAIEALVSGGAASYSIGNRSVTKHDLTKLYDELRYWQMQADRESGGTFRVAKLRRSR